MPTRREGDDGAAGQMTLPRVVRDGDVPALWRALGLPGLVDVHVHFMPQRLLEAVWAYFDAAGPLIGRRWPIEYRLAEDERLRALRAMGVRAFGGMLYPHKPGMADALNAWAAEFAARTPDCLQTVTFFPEADAGRYLAEGLAAGARVAKAHLQVGGYDPRDPLLDSVWGQLDDARVPVVVHCGSYPTPGAATGPGPMAEVLARHPRLILVVAHLGAPEYGAFLALASAHEDVHLDTTMAFTRFLTEAAPFPPALLPRLLELQDRILLGSDFPNIPHPYAHQLQSLVDLGLGDAWLRAVLWDNGARLFDVATPAPTA